ncbi:MAG: DUF4373 domain-containing protein [Prevotellaceae bacterium]|nr:DUF4373 domain-containing protein [Prevotella sp.]MDD7272830.1 DUF4373 domain-containing protein [Prevotellaceae bacterium]
MKETFYFRHDCNARQDEKILALRMKHGWEGYGLYWALIERLRENANYECVCDYNVIAYDLRVAANLIKCIVENFGLFTFTDDGKRFYSKRLSDDMNFKDELSAARSAAGKKGSETRWKTPQNNDKSNSEPITNQSQTDSKAITKLWQTDSKAIAIKEKDNIRYNNISFLDRKESETSVSGKADFEKIIDLYHSICKSFPRIIKLTQGRKQKIEIRFVDEMKGDWNLLESVFRKTEASKFLRGDNKNGWKASFDWLFSNDKNWCKVAEGNFDNRVNVEQRGISSKDNNINDEWK